MMPAKALTTAVAALWLSAAVAPAAIAGDLIVTAAKPDQLYVIDAATRSVRSRFHVADAGSGLSTILVTPNGRIAYALVGKMERIVGIDLRSGKMVFRAELSQSGERVKDFFGFTLTPDGHELIAYELPVLLKPSEYVVEEPRFAVFRTNAGLNARPVRSFPAPRRVHVLLMRPSGKSFYAIGFDVYEYDVRPVRCSARAASSTGNCPVTHSPICWHSGRSPSRPECLPARSVPRPRLPAAPSPGPD